MSYSEFLATHPPLFSRGRDPLEADDWLRTIESKFSLLNCTEYQKTMYVAQQLRGLAGAWWASYTAALPADHHVSWGEFRTAFRGHHLSAGTMHHKIAEFLDLRQGNRSVYEYIQEFNNLVQYGIHHVDTDAKKAKLFRKGLTMLILCVCLCILASLRIPRYDLRRQTPHFLGGSVTATDYA
jgi:hypothetical protein